MTATIQNTETAANVAPTTRYKWTADDKANLIKDIEATKGDATKRAKVLAKYAAKTGAQPQSVNATYYAAKSKAGSPVGQPRGARKPVTAKVAAKQATASANPILAQVSALVSRKAEIEAALDPKGLKAMEKELRQINGKLKHFA